MGDYIAKTFIIMFFIAFAVSASTDTQDVFEDYFMDEFDTENKDFYNILINNLFTFNSITGAIVVGSALLLAGTSGGMVMAGLMLGAVIPMILTPMNIAALAGLPPIALYVIMGLMTIMLITLIMRFVRGA